MFQVDLTNCDREPIHIPGKIQPHGFLIAIDNNKDISHCSTNVSSLLGVQAEELLRRPISDLDSILGLQETDGSFFQQLANVQAGLNIHQPNNYTFNFQGAPWTFTVNKSGDFLILDFEPLHSDLGVDLQAKVGRSLSEILADRKLDVLLNNSVNQIRDIIGYDRVMIYRFHDDGHGEVVAEARGEQLDSWLGLHYPASDIPQQARALYLKNLVRLIGDVNSVPAEIITFEQEPLDLTDSSLRAVSPIHIQYLKNMGVASSFSISLLDQNSLWGLIACHNYVPRVINYNQRQGAALIGQVLSSAISFRHNELIQHAGMSQKDNLNRLVRYLMSDLELHDALLGQELSALDILDSRGVALFVDGRISAKGMVPDKEQLERFFHWLSMSISGNTFQTHNLSSFFAEAIEYKEIASGALVSRLRSGPDDFIVWFRPEHLSFVKWAGNPEKPSALDERGLPFISPRTSFDVWSEMVRNCSVAWSETDKIIASQLVEEVNYAITRKAAELRHLNEKLKAAYSELDTFSYTISHDLKTPLATIKSYAQLILRGMEDDKIRSMADRIELGARKMQFMIDEVLNYSKVGQTGLNFEMVDVAQLLAELRVDMLVTASNPNLTIDIGDCPMVYGDATMLFQIFSNLIGNAVKYSSMMPDPYVSVSASSSAEHIIFTVRDNGIGIPHKDHERVFELFSRSHTGEKLEGSGIGLAIVKKIVEKHQGRIWLESDERNGTAFHIQFKNVQHQVAS